METQTDVLVIGDPQCLFLERRPGEGPLSCTICPDVITGIHQAAQANYRIIALGIQGLALKLGTILKSLRQVSDGRIVLLSQIYDEPIARRYVRQGGESHADDYLICPIDFGRWLHRLACSDNAENQHDGPVVGLESESTGVDVEKRLRELERLATEDDLTGLKNRRYVREFCQQILEYAEKENGRVTLLIYDIDDFKHYNDEYGHATGDRILREAATLMRRCCRGHDVIARVGGDEFAVVFWDDPQRDEPTGESRRRLARKNHPEEPIFIAKRFQRELERSDLGGLGLSGQGILTISGGLARFPADAKTVDELFEKADMALLEAKRSGKNRVYLVGMPAGESTSGNRTEPDN